MGIVRSDTMQLDLLSRMDKILSNLGVNLQIPRQGTFNLDLLIRLELIIEAIQSGGTGGDRDVFDVPPTKFGDIEPTNQVAGAFWYCATLSDGRTYFLESKAGSPDGINVLDEQTGQIVQTNVTQNVFSRALIGSDGKSYFCCDVGGGVWYLDEATGNILRKTGPSGAFIGAGIGADGITYFTNKGSQIYALDNESGNISLLIENAEIDYIDFVGAGSDGKTYFCGQDGIGCIDSTGNYSRVLYLPNDGFWSMFVASNNKTYFLSGHPTTTSINAGIYVLTDDGIVQTNVTSGRFSYGVVANDGKSYFASYDGKIYVLNEETDNIELFYTGTVEIWHAFKDSNNRTIFATTQGCLYLNVEEEETTIVHSDKTDVSVMYVVETIIGEIYLSGYGIFKLEEVSEKDVFVRTYKEWIKLNYSINYSLEEIKTANTWIDGKPIYRKAFVDDTSLGNLAGLEAGATKQIDLDVLVPDIEHIVNQRLEVAVYHLTDMNEIGTPTTNSWNIANFLDTSLTNKFLLIRNNYGSTLDASRVVMVKGWIEYTKV